MSIRICPPKIIQGTSTIKLPNLNAYYIFLQVFVVVFIGFSYYCFLLLFFVVVVIFVVDCKLLLFWSAFSISKLWNIQFITKNNSYILSHGFEILLWVIGGRFFFFYLKFIFINQVPIDRFEGSVLIEITGSKSVKRCRRINTITHEIVGSLDIIL